MDKSIKLLDRYKNIKLLFEIQRSKNNPEYYRGLFNLKLIKEKNDINSFTLWLQTSNPDFMPNYMVNIPTFFSKLTHQSEDNPIIGFYKLIPAKDLKVGDFLHISLEDERRYEEAPFQILSIDESVKMSSLVEKSIYKEIEMSLEDFNKIQDSDEYYKYEKLPEDWFDDELEVWIEEMKKND